MRDVLTEAGGRAASARCEKGAVRGVLFAVSSLHGGLGDEGEVLFRTRMRRRRSVVVVLGANPEPDGSADALVVVVDGPAC
jgi:hypothetical protein